MASSSADVTGTCFGQVSTTVTWGDVPRRVAFVSGRLGGCGTGGLVKGCLPRPVLKAAFSRPLHLTFPWIGLWTCSGQNLERRFLGSRAREALGQPGATGLGSMGLGAAHLTNRQLAGQIAVDAASINDQSSY